MTARKPPLTPAPAKTTKNDGVEVTTDTGTRKIGQK